jgi:hypothetical protein
VSEIKVIVESEEKDKEEKGYSDWEVHDAYCTLMKAEKIKKDPKMMGFMKEKMGEEKEAIKSLEQLKAKISEDMSENEED